MNNISFLFLDPLEQFDILNFFTYHSYIALRNIYTYEYIYFISYGNKFLDTALYYIHSFSLTNLTLIIFFHCHVIHAFFLHKHKLTID